MLLMLIWTMLMILKTLEAVRAEVWLPSVAYKLGAAREHDWDVSTYLTPPSFTNFHPVFMLQQWLSVQFQPWVFSRGRISSSGQRWPVSRLGVVWPGFAWTTQTVASHWYWWTREVSDDVWETDPELTDERCMPRCDLSTGIWNRNMTLDHSLGQIVSQCFEWAPNQGNTDDYWLSHIWISLEQK